MMADSSITEARFERRLFRHNRPVMYWFFEATLRLGPIVAVPGIGRVINDADLARAILLAPDRFNSHDPGSFGAMIHDVFGPAALINMDGPEQQRLKRELLQVFSNRYVNDIIDDIAGPLVAGLCARLKRGEMVDFAAFMRDYGGRLACALVGIPLPAGAETSATADIFWLATEIMALAGSGRRRLRPNDRAKARAYADRLYAYIATSYDDHHGLDNSVTKRLRDRGLDLETVKGLVAVVLIGATELVIYGLPRALAVMIDSGAMAQLQQAPDQIDNAIDEAIRLTTPSNVILRAVAADCQLHGHRFRQGERVLIAFRNIMRDPRRFDHPERFELGRDIPADLRRLPFGHGSHNCLGAALTLAEMRQLLGALIALPGRLEIGRRGYNRGKLYPGYTELQLSLLPHIRL